jgi:large subunit ribosomal protein L35
MNVAPPPPCNQDMPGGNNRHLGEADLHFPAASAITRPVQAAWPVKGMPGRSFIVHRKDSEMPKMKTKSSAKKRFKVTASGRIKAAQSGKRHGMIKRSNKHIRNQRGTTILAEGDERLVKIHMPYAR